MTDSPPLTPDYRAQASRLALVRVGLRRQRRLDTGPDPEVPVQRFGYYGLDVHNEATKSLEIIPDKAKTDFRRQLERLLAFLGIKPPQFA